LCYPVGVAAQEVIGQGEVGHRFYDGDGPRHYAGIVPPFALHGYGFIGLVYTLLVPQQGSYRLEGDAKKEVFPIGNAPFYATSIIGGGFLPGPDAIIVLGAAHPGSGEAASHFEAFGGIDA
jgi:hypothetical protein